MEQTPRDKRSVADLFQQVWSQALVAVTGAEEEVQRLVARLEGAAGWNPEEVRRQVRELTERLTGQRRELERRVDEGVKAAVQRLRLPRREQVEELNRRLDALSERLEALER